MAPATDPTSSCVGFRSPVLAIVELATLAFFHGAAFPLVVRLYPVAAPRRAAASITHRGESIVSFPWRCWSVRYLDQSGRSMVPGAAHGADRGQHRRRNILHTTRAGETCWLAAVEHRALSSASASARAAPELLVIHARWSGSDSSACASWISRTRVSSVPASSRCLIVWQAAFDARASADAPGGKSR